ncbi:hypothetical protein D1007_07388 [Hordeum vulgare]|nr:hypothetical protein D1007_07388 [Hordeum vulgare]
MATWEPCPFAECILGESTTSCRSKIWSIVTMSPLMRNLTKALVEKRDKYDYDYGRGVGMIDDNITYEYTVKKLLKNKLKKNKKSSTKKSTVSGRKKEGNTSEDSASQKPIMDRIWHELKETHKNMLCLTELCARRMIEKMNKTGVFYRTGNMEEEEENLHGDINESTNDSAFRDKEFVYHSNMDDYRTPSHGKMNKKKDDDGGDENSHCKPYMAMNKDDTHWVTVVMHKEKEEFQVIDSLMGKELDSRTRKLIEDLRREIGADIVEANATRVVQYLNVSTWPIKTYVMPQQEDGVQLMLRGN